MDENLEPTTEETQDTEDSTNTNTDIADPADSTDSTDNAGDADNTENTDSTDETGDAGDSDGSDDTGGSAETGGTNTSDNESEAEDDGNGATYEGALDGKDSDAHGATPSIPTFSYIGESELRFFLRMSNALYDRKYLPIHGVPALAKKAEAANMLSKSVYINGQLFNGTQDISFDEYVKKENALTKEDLADAGGKVVKLNDDNKIDSKHFDTKIISELALSPTQDLQQKIIDNVTDCLDPLAGSQALVSNGEVVSGSIYMKQAEIEVPEDKLPMIATVSNEFEDYCAPPIEILKDVSDTKTVSLDYLNLDYDTESLEVGHDSIKVAVDEFPLLMNKEYSGDPITKENYEDYKEAWAAREELDDNGTVVYKWCSKPFTKDIFNGDVSLKVSSAVSNGYNCGLFIGNDVYSISGGSLAKSVTLEDEDENKEFAALGAIRSGMSNTFVTRDMVMSDNIPDGKEMVIVLYTDENITLNPFDMSYVVAHDSSRVIPLLTTEIPLLVNKDYSGDEITRENCESHNDAWAVPETVTDTATDDETVFNKWCSKPLTLESFSENSTLKLSSAMDEYFCGVLAGNDVYYINNGALTMAMTLDSEGEDNEQNLFQIIKNGTPNTFVTKNMLDALRSYSGAASGETEGETTEGEPVEGEAEGEEAVGETGAASEAGSTEPGEAGEGGAGGEAGETGEGESTTGDKEFVIVLYTKKSDTLNPFDMMISTTRSRSYIFAPKANILPSFNVESIEAFSAQCNCDSNSSVTFSVMFQKGDQVSYAVWNETDKKWDEVADLEEAAFSGFSADKLANVPASAWKFDGNFALVYALMPKEAGSTCEVSYTNISYMTKPLVKKAVHGIDYDYAYDSKGNTAIAFNTAGRFLVNYPVKHD